MNLGKAILFLLVILIVSNSYSQGTALEPELFDEFETICSEDFRARLEPFAATFQSRPNSKGFIFLQGRTGDVGTTLKYKSWIYDYLVNIWGVDKNRFAFHRLPDKKVRKFQFWIYPAGSNLPEATEFSYQLTNTSLFQIVPADLRKSYYDRKTETHIYVDGFQGLGCGVGPNNWALEKLIEENPDFTAYLIIYNKNTKNLKKIKKLAMKSISENTDIPKEKIKTFYGGARKNPEIEFWLVKKGGTIPKYAKELK